MCHTPIISALSLSTLLLIGCQSRSGYTPHDALPLYDHTGQARSLALSTPAVRSSASSHSRPEPWYIGRRDLRPFVTAGSVSRRHEHSVTVTRDRQFVFNGRVYDRYNQTTYRKTHRDSTR